MNFGEIDCQIIPSFHGSAHVCAANGNEEVQIGCGVVVDSWELVDGWLKGGCPVAEGLSGKFQGSCRPYVNHRGCKLVRWWGKERSLNFF